MEKIYTPEEVGKHNKEGDVWLIIEDKVYDVSKFAALHPAGPGILMDYAGKDVTEIFKYFHNFKAVTYKYAKLVIGKVEKPEKE